MVSSLAVTPLVAFAAPEADKHYEQTEAGQKFIREVAEETGLQESKIHDLLAEAEFQPDIISAISRPAEKVLTWAKYQKIFLTERRIQEGRKFAEKHRSALRRAEAEYGVPSAYVTAIIGVETLYGTHKGRYRVLDALATLAFDYPPRSKFFRQELKEFVMLLQEQGFDATNLRGSYAGAMGYGQFISSSYRNFAVDFDHDGVADLLKNPVDAIGSVANYLARHGWLANGEVAIRLPATANPDRSTVPETLALTQTAEGLRQSGVSLPERLGDSDPVRLLRLEGLSGPEYWVALNNFYSITRYNHSDLYAMAVTQLAGKIAQR